jgi:WD40 repeat protein
MKNSQSTKSSKIYLLIALLLVTATLICGYTTILGIPDIIQKKLFYADLDRPCFEEVFDFPNLASPPQTPTPNENISTPIIKLSNANKIELIVTTPYSSPDIIINTEVLPKYMELNIELDFQSVSKTPEEVRQSISSYSNLEVVAIEEHDYNWPQFRKILLKSTQTGQILATIDHVHGEISNLIFNANGTQIAFSETHLTNGAIVRSCDLRTGEQLYVIISLPGVHSISFSPDNQILAITDSNKIIRLYNARNGQRINEIGADHSLLRTNFTIKGRGSTFNPTSEITAFVDDKNEHVILWDTFNNKQLISLETGNTDEVAKLAFSHNGQFLIVEYANGTIQYWGVEKED